MRKKSLQKLSESRRKVDELLEKKRVTKDDMKSLNDNEKELLQEVTNQKLGELKFEQLDELIDKIYDIINTDSRNSLWENNHAQIIREISNFIDNIGRMPTMFELSAKTGLSRQTLGKHLKEYRNHPQYIEHLEQFRFMSQKVLSKMFQLAMNGNVGAGRLYLEMVGEIGDRSNVKNETNNIQYNNLVISKERLYALCPSQVRKIEEILSESYNLQNRIHD
jgi:hypothetical protein